MTIEKKLSCPSLMLRGLFTPPSPRPENDAKSEIADEDEGIDNGHE